MHGFPLSNSNFVLEQETSKTNNAVPVLSNINMIKTGYIIEFKKLLTKQK